MRVLVTYGSKMGGTAGIAEKIGEVLSRVGFNVDVEQPRNVANVEAYDAVIFGGGLYANRWPRDVRGFVKRNADALRGKPVWAFSSGPLDASPSEKEIPPTKSVRKLMERVGARGHVTFGGWLPADAKGFVARAMARNHAGDWRDMRQVQQWALSVAQALAEAVPSAGVTIPAHDMAGHPVIE